MKLDTESKYVKISIHAFLVIAAAIILWACINNLSYLKDMFGSVIKVIKPFIYAFVIAYIFNYPYKRLLKLFDKIKTKKPLKKGIKVTFAIIISYTVLLSALGLFMYLIVPVIVNAVMGLLESAPKYVENISAEAEKWIVAYLLKFDIPAHTITEILDSVVKEISSGLDLQDWIKTVASFLVSMSVEVKNFALGIIISIYLLVDKNRFIITGKKLVYVLFGQEKGNRTLEVLRFTDNTIGGYIIAKVVDSLIIGIICYISMIIFNLEYSILISVIVGITNVIPFFGPFIGAIPSILLLLSINPWQALIFAVLILVIQQFDGNILGPRLLGDSTGIRAVYVVFAVIVGGGLFGVIGMFIGVPLFAVIYTLSAEYINEKIDKKNIEID